MKELRVGMVGCAFTGKAHSGGTGPMASSAARFLNLALRL